MKRLLTIVACLAATNAFALAPADYQAQLATAAKAADPAFAGFSAQRGAAFYRSKQGGDWSCATCHTDNPAAAGRHAVTDKAIKPLAPAANAERFSNPDKIEKWFKRNCNDVLKRTCTPQEKGDLLAWLLTIKN